MGNIVTERVKAYRKSRATTDPVWAEQRRKNKRKHHKNWELRAMADPDRVDKVLQDKRNRQLLDKRRARRAIKTEVMGHYGGACVCCGETIIEFLTIDHINGGGLAHRKKVLNQPNRERGGGGSDFYAWLKNNGYPPGFQPLCWNCNCGRQYNSGICPHKGVGHHTR